MYNVQKKLIMKRSLKNALSYRMVRFFTLFILFFFVQTQFIQAQMFSVKTNKKELDDKENLFEISLGTTFTKFSYNGPTLPSGEVPLFEFNDPTYFVDINLANINLHLDYANSLGRTENLRYISFNLKFLSDITLYKNKHLYIDIPVHLISDSFTISSEIANLNSSSSYEQAGFSLGSGLETKFIVFPGTSLNLSQLAFYGYAARGFGGTYGSKKQFESRVKFITGRIWSNSQLTFNFAYLYNVYNLEETIYDYTLNGYSIGLGITF